MDALRPAAPSPTPSIPSPARPAPAQASGDRVTLGEQRVTLHVPTGKGQFLQVRKFSTAISETIRPPSGGAIFCEETDGAHHLTRADGEGEVCYRLPLEGKARHLLSSPDGSRLYVETQTGILCVDPEHGAELGSFAFGSEEYKVGRKVLPQADGRVAVLEGKELIWLGQDLQEERRQEFPFEVGGIRTLPDGGLVAHGRGDYYHLGHVQVQAADGRVLFSSEQVRPSNIAVTTDGRIHLVEYGPSHESRLVSVDLRTGESSRREVPVMTRTIVAQPDGSLLLAEPEEYSDSTFVQYGPDGTELHRYVFDRDQRPRNLLPDPDRNQAWVVTTGQKKATVHRIRLGAGAPDEATVLVSAPGNLVVPPPLPDGRLVVFGAKGIEVYGPDGNVQATFSTIQGLKDALGDAPLLENHLLGENPLREQVSLGAWLPVAAKHLPLPDRQAFLADAAAPGKPTRGGDGCLDFARAVDTQTALQAMHLDDPMVYQRMLMREPEPSLVVGTQEKTVEFPGGGPRTTVSTDRLVVEFPGQEPVDRKFLENEAALPVKAGDEFYLAVSEKAGGSRRALAWHHPASRSYERFDVTGPIVGLYAEADRVYAVGGNGAVLTIEPELEAGERVEAPVRLPTAALQPQAGEIHVSEETVTIGGLVLERRG